MKIHKYTILIYTQTDIKKYVSKLKKKDEKHQIIFLSLSLSLFGRCRSSNESNGFKRTPPRCRRAVENHRNQEEGVVEEEEQRRRRNLPPRAKAR